MSRVPLHRGTAELEAFFKFSLDSSVTSSNCHPNMYFHLPWCGGSVPAPLHGPESSARSCCSPVPSTAMPFPALLDGQIWFTALASSHRASSCQSVVVHAGVLGLPFRFFTTLPPPPPRPLRHHRGHGPEMPPPPPAITALPHWKLTLVRIYNTS